MGQGTSVKILGSNDISGMSVVNDLYNRPALIIQVDGITRTLYNQAVNSEIMLLLSLLLLSLILFIVVVMLLQFFITSRIDKLNDGVRRIDHNGGDGEKIEVKSNDDLGSLAASINRMVDGLEASKRDLLQSERRYKAVVEDQTELVFRSTPQGTVTFANTAFLRHYRSKNYQSGSDADKTTTAPVQTIIHRGSSFRFLPANRPWLTKDSGVEQGESGL